MSSPTIESLDAIPSLPDDNPTSTVEIPLSPSSHHAPRRLASSSDLTARTSSQPSLTSQQRQSKLDQLDGAHDGSPIKQFVSSHTRTRSNSDAAVMSVTNTGPPERRQAVGRKIVAADALSLDRLIREGPPDGDVSSALESTRLKILDQGIKSDSDGMSSLRIYIWLILLNAPLLDTDAYLDLIHRGASPAYSKIRNDTFRTLTTDPLFRRRVSEASLIRLLNAVAWRLHESKTPSHTPDLSNTPVSKLSSRPKTLIRMHTDSPTEPGIYVQGMNVLAAPFLYAARSEAEAFVAFHRFITYEIPGYITNTMSGVHKGLALVDKVLAIVDPRLSFYLMSKGMNAELYAFPSVLTLCACTPPLPEVLKLWDFLFAYGAHLNILCIVAQLVILRQSILNSPSPTKILRSFPTLQADMVKEVTLTLIKKIPDDVYAEIVMHAR